jgi:hypothetical protein
MYGDIDKYLTFTFVFINKKQSEVVIRSKASRLSW